jgi:hypothetical protein
MEQQGRARSTGLGGGFVWVRPRATMVGCFSLIFSAFRDNLSAK